MTNNQFMALVRGVLRRGLELQGVANVRILQNYQGKKTSAPETPCLVFHRVDDQPRHWQYRHTAITDVANRKITQTEYQNFETTFQVNALVPRVAPEDEDINDVSAEDLLRVAHMLLQGQLMLDVCKKAGVGILHVSTFTPNWVQDEHDNWEAEPSFNIVIATKQELKWEVPAVDMFDYKIYPV